VIYRLQSTISFEDGGRVVIQTGKTGDRERLEKGGGGKGEEGGGRGCAETRGGGWPEKRKRSDREKLRLVKEAEAGD